MSVDTFKKLDDIYKELEDILANLDNDRDELLRVMRHYSETMQQLVREVRDESVR